MSSSLPFKLALAGAAICMFVQYFPEQPAGSNKQPDVIAKAIAEGTSDMVQRKSFDNVMNALNQ